MFRNTTVLTVLYLFIAAITLPTAEANNAGCDAPMVGSCSDHGMCCDYHDFCIARSCPSPCGSVIHFNANPACAAGKPIWAGGMTRAKCGKCHSDVSTCVAYCNSPFAGPDCHPSQCCDPNPDLDYCGEKQLCVSPGGNLPIYDPCQCKKHYPAGGFVCKCKAAHGVGSYCDAFCPCNAGLRCNGKNVCQNPTRAPTPPPFFSRLSVFPSSEPPADYFSHSPTPVDTPQSSWSPSPVDESTPTLVSSASSVPTPSSGPSSVYGLRH